jgi:hypothetical protein
MAALRAFGRIYAGWGLSQDFYRAGLHQTALGAPDLDTFLRTDSASPAAGPRTSMHNCARGKPLISAAMNGMAAIYRKRSLP